MNMNEASLPAGRQGHIHPISSLIREANRIFFDIGFNFFEGPPS